MRGLPDQKVSVGKRVHAGKAFHFSTERGGTL